MSSLLNKLVWPRPLHGPSDWIELAAILTPRGEADPRISRSTDGGLPIASSWAAQRLMLLTSAYGIALQIVETPGNGWHESARWDVHFVSLERDAGRMLIPALRRLQTAGRYMSGLQDRSAAAAALWRACVLSNGLIRSSSNAIAVRAPTRCRARALAAAADELGFEYELKEHGTTRVSLAPCDSEKFIERLTAGSPLVPIHAPLAEQGGAG